MKVDICWNLPRGGAQKPERRGSCPAATGWAPQHLAHDLPQHPSAQHFPANTLQFKRSRVHYTTFYAPDPSEHKLMGTTWIGLPN